MLNYIWIGLILIAVVVGGITGRIEEVTKAAIDSAETAVKLSIGLIGVMSLWLGIMKIAEEGGIINFIARVIKPLTRRLFPDVPPDHPAMGAMIMNIAANMLGLSNAATPLGLKAMQELEKLNKVEGTATNAMCTFLALNTSSLQLLPATAVALLASAGSKNPTAIISTALIATFCSTVVAIVLVKVFEKLPIFKIKNTAADTSKVNDSKEG